MQLLERYHWPGNVRELRNVIERATIVAKGDVIEPADLPPLSRRRRAGASAAATRRSDRRARRSTRPSGS